LDKRYNYYVRPYLEESMLEKIKRITLNIIKSVVKFVTDIWSKIIKKINELKERFKNNPQVQSLLNKINNSRIMQTINIAKRNKLKVERSNLAEEVNKCKEEVEGARKVQEEEVENAKNIFSKIKESMSKDKNDQSNEKEVVDRKKIKITDKFIDSVKEGNTRRVKIMIKDSLILDPTFEQVNGMLKICQHYNMQLFKNTSPHMQKTIEKNANWKNYDEKELGDYMNRLLVQCVDDCSVEQFNYVKQVVQKYYKDKGVI